MCSVLCTSFAYGLRKQKGARSAEQIVQSSNHVQTNITGHVSLCFEILSIRQDPPHANRFKTFCTLQTRSSSFLP